MPQHTFDEQVKRRAERARTRGQLPKSTRATSGNVPQAKLVDRLRAGVEGASKGARSAAGTAGRVTAGVAQEAGGIGKAFVGGAAEQLGVSEPVKQGASRAQQGLRSAREGAGKVASKLGGAAKFVGRLAGPATGAAVALGTTPVQDIPETLQRANPLTAIPRFARDVASDIGEGRGVGEAFGRSARRAIAPLSLGLVDDPTKTGDRGPTPFNLLTSSAARDELSGAVNPGGAPQAAGQGAQGPGATAPPAAPPPTGAQGAFRGAPSARGDVGPIAPTTPGAGNLVPAPGTGSFTNERTGAVTDLNFPQRAEQERGLRAAAPGPTVNEDITQKLADQARGGGIASAFGAIASGGNVLREQAAGRQRQFQKQEQRQEFENDLSIAFTKATADLPLKEREQVSEQGRTRLDALNAAEDSGNEAAVQRERANTFQSAIQGNKADTTIANGLAAEEINQLANEGGFFDLIGLGPGRSLLDVIGDFGDQPVVTLDAQKGTFIDRRTGVISQKDPDTGQVKRLGDLEGISREAQDFLRSTGTLLEPDKKTGKLGLRAGGPQSAGRLRR